MRAPHRHRQGVKNTGLGTAVAAVGVAMVLLGTQGSPARAASGDVSRISPMYSLSQWTLHATAVANSGQTVGTLQASSIDTHAVYVSGIGATAVDPFPATI